jgi:hypothetical protein
MERPHLSLLLNSRRRFRELVVLVFEVLDEQGEKVGEFSLFGGPLGLTLLPLVNGIDVGFVLLFGADDTRRELGEQGGVRRRGLCACCFHARLSYAAWVRMCRM